MFAPSNEIEPEVGVRRFSTIWATVDLPEPDSPTIAVVVPRFTEKDTLSTAVKSSLRPRPLRILKTLVRSLISNTLSVLRGCSGLTTALSSSATSAGLDCKRLEASDGAEDTRRWVYGCCGLRRISSAGPDSTTCPLYITTTFSARSAARPRSWVISSTAVPSSVVMVSRWSRICCWTVTSSALVGSSAISRRGLHARPMAISARWRMPPENSCGYWLARRAASGRPASASTWATRSLALLPAKPLAFRVSLTWKPIFHTGLRLDIGSCGTMPIELPRSSTMRFSLAWVMSSPSKMICPPETRPLPGSRPMAESAVVDLPDPDSPTMATVSPGITVRCALRTALTGPSGVSKVMARFLISSSGRSSSDSLTVRSLVCSVMAAIPCVPWDQARHARRRRA